MTSEMDELRDKLEGLVVGGLPDDAIKRATAKLRDALIEEEQAWHADLKESLAGELSSFVHDMATRAVNAMLHGNDDQARRYLQCKPYWNGQQHAETSTFEPAPIELRRKLVEAHRDLITSERITDLEAQLKGRDREIENLNRRLQHAERTPAY